MIDPIDNDASLTTKVDAALSDLALSAVSTLNAEMRTAPQAKDRIAAANSILDRLGYGRTTRVQADAADREIATALEAAAKAAAPKSGPKALRPAQNPQAPAQTDPQAPAQTDPQPQTPITYVDQAGGEHVMRLPSDYPQPPTPLED